jgi:hypothetical protein
MCLFWMAEIVAWIIAIYVEQCSNNAELIDKHDEIWLRVDHNANHW